MFWFITFWISCGILSFILIVYEDSKYWSDGTISMGELAVAIFKSLFGPFSLFITGGGFIMNLQVWDKRVKIRRGRK